MRQGLETYLRRCKEFPSFLGGSIDIDMPRNN